MSVLKHDLQLIIAVLGVKHLSEEVDCPIKILLGVIIRLAARSQTFDVVHLGVLDRLGLDQLLGYFELQQRLIHPIEQGQHPRTVSDDSELQLLLRHRRRALVDVLRFSLFRNVLEESVDHLLRPVVKAALLEKVCFLQDELGVRQKSRDLSARLLELDQLLFILRHIDAQPGDDARIALIREPDRLCFLHPRLGFVVEVCLSMDRRQGFIDLASIPDHVTLNLVIFL